MKKIMTILTVLLIFATYSWGGSSRVVGIDTSSYPDVRIRVYAEGDSIASLTLGRGDYRFNGTLLYGIKTVPSTPDGVYTVTISDSDGLVLCTATGRSTSAKEKYTCGSSTVKYEKVLSDLTLDVGNLGAGSTIIEIDFISLRE